MADLKSIAEEIAVAREFIDRLGVDIDAANKEADQRERDVYKAQQAHKEAEQRLNHLLSMRHVQKEKLARLCEQFFDESMPSERRVTSNG